MHLTEPFTRLSASSLPRRHYLQTENDGSWERPVVNNCTTCTIKNLLAFFQRDRQMDVADSMSKMLKVYHQKGQLDDYIVEEPEKWSLEDGIKLTEKAVIQFLRLIGTQPEHIYGKDKKSVQLLAQAIKQGRPLVILDYKTYTLSGTKLSDGHCYLVYPNRGEKWMVADSNFSNPIPISVEQLKEKFLNDENSEALIIKAFPEPEQLNRWLKSAITLKRKNMFREMDMGFQRKRTASNYQPVYAEQF